MWYYDKKLQYPINIKNANPKMAKYIITQYGGPDGEIGASLRYLSQRFSMPFPEAKAILNDIGTEELAHMEMVGTMVHQLLKGVPAKVLEMEGLGGYYTEHGRGVFPINASGVPFSAAAFQSKEDVLANLNEDLAAEQKARAVYDKLINLCDDPDVLQPLKFLRAREVVHYQRFGEALRMVEDKIAQKKFY
jgi:spore coat protein JC